MKTYLSLKKPLQKLCESFLRFLLQDLYVPYWSQVVVQIQSKSYVWMDALQTCLAGRLAYLRLSLQEALANKRFLVGGLIGMMALPAWKCHLFFDINARNPEFYYVNWAFFFNTIHQELVIILVSVGAFIALPSKVGFRWLAIPLVYLNATDIYLQYFYTDWSDFYKDMPSWQVWSLFAISIVPVLFALDYLVYRNAHLRRGNHCRLIGMVEMDMPWADKETSMKLLAKEFRELNSKI
jgi:hypothetical protein